MSRTLVVGDIHGAKRSLDQALSRASFNKEQDRLIFLGDTADGYPDVPECFDFIESLTNYVYVIGNHCLWLMDYLLKDKAPNIWLSQGGYATRESYLNAMSPEMDKRHLKLLQQAPAYHVEDNRLFVHGGFDWNEPIEKQLTYFLTWNRSMWGEAYKRQSRHDNGGPLENIPGYKEIFIGHTSTSHYDPELKPVHLSNVWNIDQGCGFEGKLTIMDVDTKEYWQSDLSKDLYPGYKHR